MPALYLALVKWEELQAWAAAHPADGAWPLEGSKEEIFGRLLSLLAAAKVTTLGKEGWGGAGTPAGKAWLRDRIFHGNATGC